MSGKAAGKAKPLKKPKVEQKDLSEEDLAFKKKQQEDKNAAELTTNGFVPIGCAASRTVVERIGIK